MSEAPKPDAAAVERFRTVVLPHLDAAYGFARWLARDPVLALRLAERMGETRAASRAHGIFGRVFGRIGDTDKARENLERSVDLARDSDQAETIRALLTLGHHLEVSEADYAGAEEAYSEALEQSRQIGELPAQVELHSALAQLAIYRADWEQARQSTEASADLAGRLEAVEFGHLAIHQDQIVRPGCDGVDRFAPVGHGADHRALALEQRRDRLVDGAGGEQVARVDGVSLADAVAAVLCLGTLGVLMRRRDVAVRAEPSPRPC